MDGMQALKCDFCGGRLIVDDSREFATCEMCGTKYMKTTIQQKIQDIRGSVTVEGEVQVKQVDFTIRGGTLERYNGSSTEVTIPDNVTFIGDEAFKDCKGLQRVLFPKTLVGIGKKAFYNCVSLVSVSIPASVNNIGYSAFESCTSLVQVIISANLQKDLYAFKGSPWYTQISNGFKAHGLCAFCGGQFKGFLEKRCMVCHRLKNYGWDKSPIYKY